MVKDGFSTLLTVNGDQIFMEGYNLNNLANMSDLSSRDFLELLQIYILIKRLDIGCSVIFRKSEEVRFLPKTQVNSINIGEVLVDLEHYNEVKNLAFDLAYEKCSGNIEKSTFDGGIGVLTNNLDVYSCTYLSPNVHVSQMISKIPIAREEQTKKKALLKIR